MTSSRVSGRMRGLLTFVSESSSSFHLWECVESLKDSSEREELHNFEAEKAKTSIC